MTLVDDKTVAFDCTFSEYVEDAKMHADVL